MSAEPQEAAGVGSGADPVAQDVHAAVQKAPERHGEREVISEARTVKLEGLHAYYGETHAVRGVT